MAERPAAVEVSLDRQGRLVLEKPEQIKQRLRARFAQVPAGRQLVDELIAEWRKGRSAQGGE